MTRFTKHDITNSYDLAYGLDHAVGMFIQVSQRGPDGEDEYLIDIDEMSDPGITPERIKEIASEYGFEIDITKLDNTESFS